MLRQILSIAFWSFLAGLCVQLVFSFLYVSSNVGQADFLLLLMLTLYLPSDAVLLSSTLYFCLAVPLYISVFRYVSGTGEDPSVYPVSTVPVGLMLTIILGWMSDLFDWRLLAFLLPAGLVFGCLWWNRLEAKEAEAVQVLADTPRA